MASSDDPPFLNVGTEVSAKYRGAFCEATIKIARKLVKCKVSYNKGQTDTVPNDVIKGPLKVGANVEVRQSDGQYLSAVILKLTDATTYTVVFDDGDERTLKRSSLCLKGGRHYSASESLDQMPLTDPENFGTPVNYQTKRGNKRKQYQSNKSSSPETVIDSPSKKCNIEYPIDFPVGKCVLLENDRRRSCWLPGVVVPAHYMDKSEVTSDTVCIRSFKDGRFYACKTEELHTFSPDKEPLLSMLEGDTTVQSLYMCKPAIERAMAYLDTGDLPWDMELNDSNELVNVSNCEEELSEEQKADRESFYERLKKFQEDKGITSPRQPSLAHQDLDLYRLYKLVKDNGGVEKVTQEFKWRSLYLQLGMPPLANSSHILKQAYKRHLHPFECYEKAKEEGRLRNPRKRIAIPDSDEELDKTLSVKQEKPDHKSDWSVVESSDTESTSFGESNGGGLVPDDLEANEGISNDEIKANDRIKVMYGRGKTLQTFEAKVLDIDSSNTNQLLYYVHYSGWNSRHDEWIDTDRIIGKLTTPTKGPRRPPYAKKKQVKLKQTNKSKDTNIEKQDGSLDTITTATMTTHAATPLGIITATVTTPTNSLSSLTTTKGTRRRRKASESDTLKQHVDHILTSNVIANLTTPLSVNVIKKSTSSHIIASHDTPMSPISLSPPTTLPSPDHTHNMSHDTISLKAEEMIEETNLEEDHVKRESNSDMIQLDNTYQSSQPLVSSTSKTTTVSTSKSTVVSTSKPTVVSTSKATTVSTSKPTTVSTSKPTTVSTSKTTTVSTSKPTTVPTSKTTTVSTSKPTMVPTSKTTTVSTSKPTMVSTSKPTTVSTSKATTVSTSKPTTVSTSKATTVSTSKPTTVSTSKPTAVSTSKPTMVSTSKPSAVSTSKPTAVSTSKTTTVSTSKTTTVSTSKDPTLSSVTKATVGASTVITTTSTSPISTDISTVELTTVASTSSSTSSSIRDTHDSGVDNSSGSEEYNTVQSTLHTVGSRGEDLDFTIDTNEFSDLCASERIALIQERMKSIQKKYMELKAEVSYLERRKRKAKRRERENARNMTIIQDTINSTTISTNTESL